MTGTTGQFQLPPELGGAVVDGRVIRTGIALGLGNHPAVLLLFTTRAGDAAVPLALCTEIKPPLPPEPNGEFYVIELDGKFVPRMLLHQTGFGWFIAGGDGRRYTWAKLCEKYPHGTVIPLLPDTTATPIRMSTSESAT